MKKLAVGAIAGAALAYVFKRRRRGAEDSWPSDVGAARSVRSTTSTSSPPSIHACVQSAFTKLAM